MKLFKLLQKLSKKEISKFQHYLASPLFNRRQDVQLLLENWISEKGRSHPSSFYWSKVYSAEQFSTKKWTMLCSRLFKLLEAFLAFSQMQKEEPLQKSYLAKAYRKLQLEKLFTNAIKDSQIALKKQPYRNANYLQDAYKLSYERYDYISSSNRKDKNDLQQVIDQLDCYLIAAKLKQASNALSRTLINQEKYEVGLIEDILNYIEEEKTELLSVPAIAIYYYCYQAIQSKDDEQTFAALRKSIREYQHFFPPAEIRDIYIFAINFAIRKSNKGSTFFIRETFELYNISLNQGFLLEDGIMLESTYSNIVSLALRLKKYDWAAQFIEEYRVHLKPQLQEPYYFFNLGKLYYQQGNLEKSLQQLIKVDNLSSFLYLAARILQLKIYYELKEIDPLESLLESLRVYLQRSKDLAYRKEHYSNILLFTKRLLQLPIMSKAEKKALEERGKSVEVFGEREWFLKQIEN